MHLPFLWPRESCLFSQNPNLTLSFRFPTYEKHWVTPPRKPLVLMKRQWSPVAGVPAFSLPSTHSFAQNVRAEWGSAGRICILKGESRKQRSKMQMEGLGQTPAGVFQGSATGPPDRSSDFSLCTLFISSWLWYWVRDSEACLLDQGWQDAQSPGWVSSCRPRPTGSNLSSPAFQLCHCFPDRPIKCE